MVVKEWDPARTTDQPVRPGDNLYFLRNKEEYALRVKATVVRVLSFTSHMDDDDRSHFLKEMQTRLQLTEDQYNLWSAKGQVQLVEFGSAHKIDLIQIASNKITDRTDWIAFEQISLITE